MTGGRHLGSCGARLQADPARVPHEQQPIGARLRERLDRDPALSVLAHVTGRHEALSAGQPGQRRLPPADQDRQPGLPEPHITHPEAVRLQALRLPPCLDHPRHLVAEPPAQPMHQPRLLLHRKGDPRRQRSPHLPHGGIQAPRHPLLQRSGSPSSRSPRPRWPGPRARGAPPPTQRPRPAVAVGADVPGERTAPAEPVTDHDRPQPDGPCPGSRGEPTTDLADPPPVFAPWCPTPPRIAHPGAGPAIVTAGVTGPREGRCGLVEGLDVGGTCWQGVPMPGLGQPDEGLGGEQGDAQR